MKFSCYLPDYNDLETSAFYPHPKDAFVRRLRLEIDHVVTGMVGNKARYGKGIVAYNLDFGLESQLAGRMITETKVYSGIQSTEFLAHEYERVRARTSYSAQHFGTGMFDMRAIMYVLGAAQMGGVSGTNMLRSKQPALYKTLGGGYTTPRAGDVTVGPNLFTTRHEFVTLLTLFGEAGVKAVQLMTDYVPGSEATLLTGVDLARYAQRLAFNVLYAANSTVTFGLHFQAYLSGMLSVCTLNSHSDEGGWVRRMLITPDYCIPCGVLFCMDSRFGALPLAEKVSSHEIARNTYGMFLEGMAMLPLGDIKAHGKTSIATRLPDARRSVNSYEDLLNQVDAVMTGWRELLCDLYDAHRDGVQSYGDFNAYISQDPVDRHFDNEVIAPWWFIEPSPFITKDYDFYKPPARTGAVVTLPMLNSAKVTHSRSVVDPVTGALAPGATIGIVREPGDIRMEGFTYLMSGLYSKHNGLAQMTIQRSKDGEGPDAAMFFDPDEQTYSNQRWVLPDCSVAHPLEGFTVEPQQLYYRVIDDKSLTPLEASSGTVRSFFGTFRVGKNPGVTLKRTHRNVPVSVRNSLLAHTWDSDAFQFAQTVTVKGTPATPATVPIRVEPRTVATADITVTPTIPLATDHVAGPDVTAPKTSTTTTAEGTPSPPSDQLTQKVKTPPPPLTSDAGPSTAAKSADMGIRPKAPDSTVKKADSPDESKGSD